MKINRLLTNICSDDLSTSKNFYTKLFDLEVDYDSDWFVHLTSKEKRLELGIIDRTHKLVPEAYQKKPTGLYLTFVVDDADELYTTAINEGFETVEEPSDTFYGQRRFLVKDPDGTLLDVSSPISDFR